MFQPTRNLSLRSLLCGVVVCRHKSRTKGKKFQVFKNKTLKNITNVHVMYRILHSIVKSREKQRTHGEKTTNEYEAIGVNLKSPLTVTETYQSIQGRKHDSLL